MAESKQGRARRTRKAYRLTIHTWAANHGLSVWSAKLSHQVVTFAEMMWVASNRLRDRGLDDRLPARPLSADWLALYRDHHRVCRVVADVLPEWQMTGAETEETLSITRAVRNYCREKPEEFKAEVRKYVGPVRVGRVRAFQRLMFRNARKEYIAHLEEMADWAEARCELDVSNFDDDLAKYPELYFFVRVVFMCLVEYAVLPVDLLHQTMESDPEKRERAIEKLLRLDDMMLHEPRIQRWINEHGGPSRGARLDQAMAWAKRGPVGQNHAWHFKECVGGLISALSERVFFVFDWRKLRMVRQSLRKCVRSVH